MDRVPVATINHAHTDRVPVATINHAHTDRVPVATTSHAHTDRAQVAPTNRVHTRALLTVVINLDLTEQEPAAADLQAEARALVRAIESHAVVPPVVVSLDQPVVRPFASRALEKVRAANFAVSNSF
jgi:hypothetical protein